jgi:hypothetical protein
MPSPASSNRSNSPTVLTIDVVDNDANKRAQISEEIRQSHVALVYGQVKDRSSRLACEPMAQTPSARGFRMAAWQTAGADQAHVESSSR